MAAARAVVKLGSFVKEEAICWTNSCWKLVALWSYWGWWSAAASITWFGLWPQDEPGSIKLLLWSDDDDMDMVVGLEDDLLHAKILLEWSSSSSGMDVVVVVVIRFGPWRWSIVITWGWAGWLWLCSPSYVATNRHGFSALFWTWSEKIYISKLITIMIEY